MCIFIYLVLKKPRKKVNLLLKKYKKRRILWKKELWFLHMGRTMWNVLIRRCIMRAYFANGDALMELICKVSSCKRNFRVSFESCYINTDE